MILGALDILGLDSFSIWGKKVVIGLCNAIYGLINVAFQIFLFLANAGSDILDDESASLLLTRIYEILGIAMLFVLAYNLLLFIADPDKNSKMDSSGKMVVKFFTTLILIFIMPFIFDFAYEVQDSIFPVITNLFNEEDTTASSSTNNDETFETVLKGRKLAVTVYSSFWEFSSDTSEKSETNAETINSNIQLVYNGELDGENYTAGTTIYASKAGEMTFEQAKAAALFSGDGTFSAFKAFSGNWEKGTVTFQWFIALAAGVFFCYIIISFCFDLAVRCVKLAFLQMMAPICIVCRMIPKSENIYNNWKKNTLEAYFLVFTRLFSMSFGLYLVNIILDNFTKLMEEANYTSFVTGMGRVFIILGLITFIKEAPKYLSNILGVKGEMKLGIREKFAAGGGFAATSAAIGLARGGVRGAVRGVQNGMERSNKTIDQYHKDIERINNGGGTAAEKARARRIAWLKAMGSHAGNAVSGVASAATSAVGSTIESGKDGLKAKNLKDSFKAATTGTAKVEGRAAESSAYINAHGGFVGALKDTASAEVKNIGAAAASFAGITKTADEYLQIAKKAQPVLSKIKDMETEAENLVAKNSGNASIVADMSQDKGKAALIKDLTQENAALYQSLYDTNFKGLSIDDMKGVMAKVKEQHGKFDQEEFIKNKVKEISSNKEASDKLMGDYLKQLSSAGMLDKNLETFLKASGDMSRLSAEQTKAMSNSIIDAMQISDTAKAQMKQQYETNIAERTKFISDTMRKSLTDMQSEVIRQTATSEANKTIRQYVQEESAMADIIKRVSDTTRDNFVDAAISGQGLKDATGNVIMASDKLGSIAAKAEEARVAHNAYGMISDPNHPEDASKTVERIADGSTDFGDALRTAKKSYDATVNDARIKSAAAAQKEANNKK